MSDTNASEPLQPIVLPAGEGPAGTPVGSGSGGSSGSPGRQRRFGDTAGSIVLLIVSLSAYLIGLVIALFGFLLAGFCSSHSCNAAASGTVQAFTITVLSIVLLLGSATTIVLIVLRRRAFWVALIMLLVIVVGWIVGAVAYFIALST